VEKDQSEQVISPAKEAIHSPMPLYVSRKWKEKDSHDGKVKWENKPPQINLP
jgi:hypothetical protein